MTNRPSITLAQVLKVLNLVDSGGAAKHRVRAGGVLVDGVEELRPGRQLFGGEQIEIDGESITVDLPTDE